uniref:Fanconi anemia core complex-associated protein 24 pseudonuclease domain-containing protein n=1 Tax=Pseudonaja textilis TaxID=8673 RepID=A0A670ZTS1_PSETE
MANDGTPVRAGAINVPLGHVIGHEKWKGSQVAQEMQGKLYLDKITEFCLPSVHPKI